MSETPLSKYRSFYRELTRYREILSILHWDSEVVMPEGARPNRSEQISQLSKLCHKLFTGEEFSGLIDSAKGFIEKKDFPDRKLLEREFEILQRDRDRASKLSPELVEKFSRITNLAHGTWVSAKKNKSFKEFEAPLTEIVDIVKEMAECYGYATEKYDALLEDYETGTKAASLEILFSNLKNSLIPVVQKAKKFTNPFKNKVPEDFQKSFNEKLPARLGLPKSISRLDISAHPFSTSLGSMDKRITTRYDLSDPISSIFGVLHETGHSLYEKGLSEMPEPFSPLASAVSLGVHESQSRLWENQVGRSKPFWEFYYPKLLEEFRLTSQDLPFEKLYSFINSTERSKIRVEADQVTYNLHIILRFEIERELISGILKVKDLPEIWNEKIQKSFGLEIENDAEGVLQDVHWSGGAFGYFPTYTLGNIYSAQLFHFFQKSHEGFAESVRRNGDFSDLL
ncbi:MAG: carboxypeptidase M32, partial [Leptospira sp.]|nr:carboxypeptidase M32 [Leptospira sp.]